MSKQTIRKAHTIHQRDVLLNKKNLKDILDKKGMGYKELHSVISDAYGLDLTYKGFMSLISNQSTWKLIYAWAIVDVLHLHITDIFDVVDIDVEKKAKEKENWKRKYQE